VGHEEETVIPKHTIHCFGQAGMSRRNRSSWGEKKGVVRREEWSRNSARWRRKGR